MGDAKSDSLLDLEHELRPMIRRIAGDSAKAILGLWDPAHGCYWRDTEHRKINSSDTNEFFPTVTYRSTEALLDLVFRHPEWLHPNTRRMITNDRLPKVFEHPLSETVSALDFPDTPFRNPFTTALYLISACRANRAKPGHLVVPPTHIEAAVEELFRACLDGDSPYSAENHPFIQFHILRAIVALWPKRLQGAPEKAHELHDQILRSVKDLTENLLAKHMLNQLGPTESVGLIFCAATLAFEDESDTRQYVLPALTVGLEAQDSSGCWPLGRILRQSRGKHGTRAGSFTITTYEIAWAASETVLRLLKQREASPSARTTSILQNLISAGRYADKSSVELREQNPKRGWCSDAPWGWLLVESWTSANVLQSMISLSELLDERVCNETLQTFEYLDPRSEDWPAWKRWEKLMQRAGPEDEHPTFETLNNNIVAQIKNDPRKLPSSKNESVSALFFGPPGTSKTTLVHALADGLGWPIVMLSPGDFITKGLEYIEAQARAVFARLHKLHRVVVLFDECDELFRERKISGSTDQVRSITAFVTASMLPKLQDLHDRGRVVFCICTNKFDSLDPAMRRKGRIDHIIPVGPPQKAYRERIVTDELERFNSQLKEPLDIQLKEVIVAQLVHATDGFVRGEIKRACKVILSMATDWTHPAVVSNAVSTVADQMKESLTISPGEYDTFKKLAEKYKPL